MTRPCLLATFAVCVALSRATPILAQFGAGPILARPDAYEALNTPQCVTAAEESTLPAEDRILGCVRNGEACAYPLRLMNVHRVVNDHLGGATFLITYCPDSRSCRAYDPQVEGRDLTFTFHGWQYGTMLIADRETGSLWSHLTGRCISGELEGRMLFPIPTMETTWRQWSALHPDSWIVAVDYETQYTEGGTDVTSEGAQETRAEVEDGQDGDALVVGVLVDGEAKAFAASGFGRALQTPDVLLLADPETGAVAAFRPEIDGRALRFEESDEGVCDLETGSTWNIEGVATGGRLQGRTLPRLQSTLCRFYAWQAWFPDAVFPAPVGVLVRPDEVATYLESSSPRRRLDRVVIELSERYGAEDYERALRLADEAGLPVWGWIEVARNPQMADQHAEWMASLGRHDDWRERFPNVPPVGEGEVAKVYPWVTIWYEEAFDAHLARLRALLDRAGGERLAGLYLNDIQGAPASCGCPNDQCRWATDYGVPSTATRLEEPGTPARFVAAVGEMLPERPVLPVWTIECEGVDQADPAHSPTTGYCGSVGCYHGTCWRAYAEQLAPVLEQTGGRLALAGFYRQAGRDLPVYGDEAGWIAAALGTFEHLPPERERAIADAGNIVVFIQGWDVSDEEIAAQIEVAQAAGAGGCVIATFPVDQSWEPRIVALPPQE